MLVQKQYIKYATHWCWLDPATSAASVWAGLYVWIYIGFIWGAVSIVLLAVWWKPDEDKITKMLLTILYPIFFLIVWVPPAIDRTFQTAGLTVTALADIHSIVGPLKGVLNFVALSLNLFYEQHVILNERRHRELSILKINSFKD